MTQASPSPRNGQDWSDAGSWERLLLALGQRPRGLFTDIDGTLSPIAPTPAEAHILPGVRELLAQTQTAFDVVAAVSGRAARNARHMVGIPSLTYIGNHGLEWLEPGDGAEGAGQLMLFPGAEAYEQPIRVALEEVGAALAPLFPDAQLEAKGVTGSIHVRRTSDPAAAEAAAYAAALAAAETRGLRVTRGKLVVELRPPLAVDKGVAVATLIAERGLRSAIYLGDDTTDIDAFRALRRLTAAATAAQPFVGVSIAVLQEEAPPALAAEADLTLPSIAAVPDLLRWLLAHAHQA
ncbi:MAG: trehalose-phosphatase [Ktedonobacterales bacterium]